MIRVLLTACLVVACTPADDRTLTLDGPDTIVVDHYGPVRGPTPVLSDGTVPDPISIQVVPPEVASVEGLVVSATAPGEAQVELEWKGQKASWQLKVEPRVTLRILKPPATLKVGEREVMHLQATMGGEPTEPGEITWSSSATDIATVSESGEVEGVAAGVVYIVAKRGESEAMVELSVQD